MFEKLMGGVKKAADGVKSVAANAGILTMLLPQINKLAAPYGTVKSLAIEDRRLKATVLLNGLEDREISVVCHMVVFNEDNSQVKLGGYKANMPFVENALNNFAVRTYDIPEGVARTAVAQVRGLFG